MKKTSDAAPVKFTAADLDEMAGRLAKAAEQLTASAVKMRAEKIPHAYFQLAHLHNTLLDQVLGYARDAANLTDDEIDAKRRGTVTKRTKNVERYYDSLQSTVPVKKRGK